MLRRDFMLLTAAVTLVPAFGSAAPLAYTPGMVQDRLAAGETIFLDFTASWCTTCAAQRRVIEALKAENPAYEDRVTFIDVDWDLYASDPLTTGLSIPRRSTLVVLRGDQELGRIVAGTSRDDIQALMDIALQAAA